MLAYEGELSQMVSLLHQNTIQVFKKCPSTEVDNLHDLVYALSLFSWLESNDRSGHDLGLQHVYECLQPHAQKAIASVSSNLIFSWLNQITRRV